MCCLSTDCSDSVYKTLSYLGGGGGRGAKVLGKLSMPGCPTTLDNRRARAYRTCGRCGWGCLDILSPSLGDGPFISNTVSKGR